MLLTLRLAVFTALVSASLCATLGFHGVVLDAHGNLQPWSDPVDVLKAEMNYYFNCPNWGGKDYPVYVTNVFMNGDYEPTGMAVIPGMLSGMGMLSYLKYYRYTNRTEARALARAQTMATYVMNETLTKPIGAYPSFPRSTGLAQYPLTCSAQGDMIFGCDTIEPDKGGIMAYALLELYKETPDPRYVSFAAGVAAVLVKNMRRDCTTDYSPWPMRVDSVTGIPYGDVSSNMIYIQRLFDGLVLDHNMTQFSSARDALWTWIVQYQIPSPATQGQSLWVGFFEDQYTNDDRVSWSPLMTAKYLLERRGAVSAQWLAQAQHLMNFAVTLFGKQMPYNFTGMGEQDEDHKPWGGANTNWIGTTAIYGTVTNNATYLEMARRGLAWWTYFVDSDGCPSDSENTGSPDRGGWQEDAHTDVVHNIVDTLVSLGIPYH